MLSTKKKLVAEIVINVTAWAIILLLPFVFFQYNRSEPPFQSQRFTAQYLGSAIFLLIFFYTNKGTFIPKILANKRSVPYILIILGCFFLYLTLMYNISRLSPETREFLKSEFAQKMNFRGPKLFSTGPMTLFLLVFIIGAGSKVVNEWFQADEIREEVSRQQLQTELSLLKSQVNPHFLFNTLNSIYSLSVSNSDKTPDAVLKLSKIMRYTLEESQNDKVMLSQEIDFINSYIDLQKVRLTEKSKIIFNTEGPIDRVLIAPLLFIPFIENAFKYGISTHISSAIRVDICVNNKTIILNCYNDIIPGATKQSGTGTGISNTKRRLELLYPNKHTLEIQNTANSFTVKLAIEN